MDQFMPKGVMLSWFLTAETPAMGDARGDATAGDAMRSAIAAARRTVWNFKFLKSCILRYKNVNKLFD
jgi:hypothetical protein